jgi:hypothetical protein
MKKTLIAILAAAAIAAPAAAAPAKGIDAYWVDKGASYPAAGAFAKPKAWAPGQYVTTGQLS